MLTVAKPAYAAPVVSGGYSGTLPGYPAHRSLPVRIRAPGFDLSAPVVSSGISDGEMALPGNVGVVGWLRKSAGYADKIGTTVIAGHVSDRQDRRGALWHLSSAERGQVVTITRGTTAQRFAVVATTTLDRSVPLPHGYFATTGRHRLVLISCTDRVVTADGHFHYARYQCVIAKTLARRPAR